MIFPCWRSRHSIVLIRLIVFSFKINNFIELRSTSVFRNRGQSISWINLISVACLFLLPIGLRIITRDSRWFTSTSSKIDGRIDIVSVSWKRWPLRIVLLSWHHKLTVIFQCAALLLSKWTFRSLRPIAATWLFKRICLRVRIILIKVDHGDIFRMITKDWLTITFFKEHSLVIVQLCFPITGARTCPHSRTGSISTISLGIRTKLSLGLFRQVRIRLYRSS
jgi:hypothetical protein